MPVPLINASKSLNDFISEARKCNDELNMGFSPMLLAFSVILGVGEAITTETQILKQLNDFTNKDNNHSLWIYKNYEALSNETLTQLLKELRNALAHNASTPHNVFLVCSADKLKGTSVRNGNIIICVKEFLDAVEEYVNKMVAARPNVTFDAHAPRNIQDRSPAEAGKYKIIPASGSAFPTAEEEIVVEIIPTKVPDKPKHD
jgi:hypothetical protein